MQMKVLSVLALAAIIANPAFSQDDTAEKKKKGNRGRQNASAQMIKQLADVSLTEDQIAKIKELGNKAGAEMKTIRESSGITAELMKKRAAAAKSMKDSDKKGKELQAAINKAAGYTEAHTAAMAKSNAVRMKFQKDVVALLTDEQKEKLPARMNRSAQAKKKGAGAKKGDAKKKKKTEE